MGYRERGPDTKRAINSVDAVAAEQLRAPIEVLFTYKYEDGGVKPIYPIKPQLIRPPPLPWSPKARGDTKLEIKDKEHVDLRLIKLLSGFEYGKIKNIKPVVLPSPLDPITLDAPQLQSNIDRREA